MNKFTGAHGPWTMNHFIPGRGYQKPICSRYVTCLLTPSTGHYLLNLTITTGFPFPSGEAFEWNTHLSLLDATLGERL
jgi:hypothetical protein